MDTKDTRLSRDDFTLNARQIILRNEFLSQLTIDEHTFEIFTSKGLYELTLSVSDRTDSYLLTNHNISYTANEDIILHAETFGKGIVSLNGGSNDNLKESEYTIDHEMLRIDSTYFERLIEETSDGETVIMSIALNDGEEDTIITYIFIDITNP